jgi:preprotein translocase subunit YajC
MAASGTENNFKSSIVFPTAGAFVVFVALAAYRKQQQQQQQQQRLLVAGTKIEADDLESQNVATPAQRGSRYGTSA